MAGRLVESAHHLCKLLATLKCKQNLPKHSLDVEEQNSFTDVYEAGLALAANSVHLVKAGLPCSLRQTSIQKENEKHKFTHVLQHRAELGTLEENPFPPQKTSPRAPRFFVSTVNEFVSMLVIRFFFEN